MRWVRWAPVLGAAFGLCACGPRPGGDQLSTAPPSLRVAEAALAGGATPVAVAMLEGVVEREPRNVAALTRLGDANAAMGRYPAATESYRKALAIDPGRIEARLGLGRVMLAENPAEAEAMFRSILATEPRQAAALNNLGIAQDRQGRHAEAQASYRAAIAANPAMTAAMANLGLSLALSGQAEEAVATLRPLALDPSATARVRHNYATALAAAGRRAEAERVLRRDLPEREAREAVDGFADAPP